VQAQQLHRVRRVVEGPHAVDMRVDGRACINFCSNDYLGLGGDPRLAEAAGAALRRVGTGSGAAALVSGYNAEHRRLEEALAEFLGRPRALLFSTGWAGNLGVIRALLGRGDWLIADELNHASLIDGGRLSGAHYLRAAHADAVAFGAALKQIAVERAKAPESLTLVATDGVFSMDGDLAPLQALADLARLHDASLMVDDAHGLGVLGAGGRGTLEHLGLGMDEVPVLMGTLGKAVGAAGAYVAGSEDLIEFMIQRARPWIFSTAPPPAIAAAACEGLRLMAAEPQRRAQLHDNIRYFRLAAAALGLPLGGSDTPATPIQPVILGSAAAALEASRELMDCGYWVAAIRPPTVPPGTSRLRITLSAAHRREHIDGLIDALARSMKKRERLA
jgi:8-amino-7-oxononanoate synthase